MPVPSLAQSFFEQIANAPDKIAFLTGLADLAHPRFEEEWLEFKRAPDINGADVQQNWSKALSGFANTGGGVLIWGIKADKDPTTGVDCASATALIDNPAALKSRLMQLHHQATDPPVLGVLVEQFSNLSGKGFVVCLVPESRFKPHRAEHEKNKPYYLRAGDDFVVAPVAVLRAMFHPRTKPHLRVRASFMDLSKTNKSIRWLFQIQNTGTATARDICMCLKTCAELDAPLPGQGCTKGGNDPIRGLVTYCSIPIHPGSWHDILTIEESLQGQEQNIRWHNTKFTVYLYASDHEPQAAELVFTDHDFINRDPKYGVPVEIPEFGA